MLEVYFEALLTGRQIFIAICTFFVGIMMGGSRIGFFWKFIWSLPILFFLFAFHSDAEHIQTLYYLARSGAGGPEVDNALLPLLLTHPILYFLWWAFGAVGQAEVDHKEREKVALMSAADITRELNILTARPELSGSGWFAQRWVPMTDSEREVWSDQHLEALKELRLQGDEDGLKAFGTNLPEELAIIDMQTA